jgi:hypothetical protein
VKQAPTDKDTNLVPLVVKGGVPMKQVIFNAIDWVSVKLTGISLPFLFFTPGELTKWLGVIALCSTIVYNTVRIVKELLNKKSES